MIHDLSMKKCGCLLIVEGNTLLGIFTDGDLRRALAERGGSVLEEKMGSLMTGEPKVALPGELAWEAMERMEGDPLRPVTVLPVVENGELKGLLRLHDILQV